MREILFRGRRIDNMEWVFGSLLYREDMDEAVCAVLEQEKTPLYQRYMRCRDEGIFEQIEQNPPLVYKHWVVSRYTVGQFTGLCDKNGNRIFDGDVLEIERKSDGLGTYFDPPLQYPAKVVVRWDMCSWLWEVCGQEEHYLHFPDAWCHYKCQVVGNIYDNPELMNEETK